MVASRDEFMARALWEAEESEVIAVVGLAHCEGISNMLMTQQNFTKV